MSVQVLSLASGRMSSTAKSVLYPSSAISVTTMVKNIQLYNTDSQPRTVNLYFAPNGVSASARMISPQNVTIPAGGFFLDDLEITMMPNDQILGDANVGNVVDYVISGIQR